MGMLGCSMRTRRRFWATALLGSVVVAPSAHAAPVKWECQWLPYAQYWLEGCKENRRYYAPDEVNGTPPERGGGYTG